MHSALIDLEQANEALAARVAKLEAHASSPTLAEIEAMAERLGKAVATIREAQALLGGRAPSLAPLAPSESVVVADQQQVEDPIAAHRRRQLQAPEPPPTSGKIRWSPAEQADRARALNQFTPDPSLPDDIAAMETE